MKQTVARYEAIAAGSASGDGFSSSTVDAPTDSGNSSSPPSPKVKASGGLPMKTSSRVGRSTWRGQQAQDVAERCADVVEPGRGKVGVQGLLERPEGHVQQNTEVQWFSA